MSACEARPSCEPEYCELVIESDDPAEPVKTVDVVAYSRCRCVGKPTCGCGRDEHRCGD